MVAKNNNVQRVLVNSSTTMMADINPNKNKKSFPDLMVLNGKKRNIESIRQRPGSSANPWQDNKKILTNK